ncbi:MAG: hypothetical protein P8179_23600 [Candidatus Thiodiazotropha sp.]
MAERNSSQPPVTGAQSLEGTESVLTRKSAPGVDNMSWIGYGERLYDHLADLHTRLRQHRYKLQPSLRAWITKENGAQRPIGITALVWCFIQIDDDSVSPEGKPAQARILRCNA